VVIWTFYGLIQDKQARFDPSAAEHFLNEQTQSQSSSQIYFYFVIITPS